MQKKSNTTLSLQKKFKIQFNFLPLHKHALLYVALSYIIQYIMFRFVMISVKFKETQICCKTL